MAKKGAVLEVVEVEIPDGLSFPMHIDERNEAIAGADGVIHVSYYRTNETNKKLKAARIAKFMVGVLNGSIHVSKDKSGKWIAEMEADANTGI